MSLNLKLALKLIKSKVKWSCTVQCQCCAVVLPEAHQLHVLDCKCLLKKVGSMISINYDLSVYGSLVHKSVVYFILVMHTLQVQLPHYINTTIYYTIVYLHIKNYKKIITTGLGRLSSVINITCIRKSVISITLTQQLLLPRIHISQFDFIMRK